MGLYTGANTEEQKLECDIAMYLTYQWVYGRQMQTLLYGKKNDLFAFTNLD